MNERIKFCKRRGTSVKTGRIQKVDWTLQIRYRELSYVLEVAKNKIVTFGTIKSKNYINV